MKAIFHFIRLVVIRAEKFPINKELTARLHVYLFCAYILRLYHTYTDKGILLLVGNMILLKIFHLI